MAAELRLGVSFDLVYFRQQLQKLSQIAASEFTAPIKIKLDRRVVDQELNNLQRLFSRRQYTIRLNDQQVQAAVDRVSSLQRSLVSLRRATATPIEIKVKYTTTGDAPGKGAGGAAVRRAVGSQNLTEGASRADLQALYKFAREAQIPFEQLKRGAASSTEELRRVLGPAFRGIGKDVKGGITAGLADANSQLARLGAQMGDSLLSAVKKQLGIASPSREFKKIGEDSGEGFEQGLESGLNEATRVGVREMRDLFRSLQREAQAGTMKLAALMQGAMAGVVQLPGGRQQRGRLMQTGAAINARMAGPVVPNIVQRQSAVRGQAASAGTATPAFLSALPLMLGMSQRELLNNLTGLSGQSYRAPEMGGRQAPRPGRIASLLDALASSRGGIGGGLSSLVSTRGGLTNPGLASAGYIGRTALSPQYVNYPPGMPAAYGAGFTGAASGSFSMARQAMQGPMLPTRGIFAAAPAPAFGSLGQFPTAGMAYPSSPLGRITPQSSMFGAGSPPGGGGGGGGAGGGGLGGFGGGAFRAVGADIASVTRGLPGKGTIREIGEEFGFAAKQVLLFGSAYKALAFITSFPAQVGQAVASLQTFNNTLNAIMPSAQAAGEANAYILSLVDRYNVPLASAREGFTRLYASMAPAGFNADQITSLFTGVTQAAATFGMSADKVDRVNYAFAQMASKGQVMSEELKGQLGDVLPGAMGIFAEAAGFKGPDAIQKFSKALEDGAYKGESMVKLLDNVGIVMQREFGPGAEGAARTFQGVMNRMQNSMLLFYESFEPVAVGFMNAVVLPITQGIKEVTDGFNAFMRGQEATTAGGAALAQQLTALRPAFEGIVANLQSLAPLFQATVEAALGLLSVFVNIAGNPITGFFLKLYATALLLTGAIKVLGVQALYNLIRQLIATNVQMQAMAASTVSARVQMMMLANGTTGAGFAFSSAARQVTMFGVALRAVISTTVIGFALVAIGLLIERMQQLRAEADAIKNAGKGAKQAVVTAYSGGREAGRSAARAQEAEALSASDLSGVYRKLADGKPITEAEYNKAKELGADLPNVVKIGPGRYGPANFTAAGRPTFRADYERQALQQAQRAQNIRTGVSEGQRQGETMAEANERRQKQQLSEIEAAAKEGKAKKTSLESYYNLQDQLAKDFTQAQIDRLEEEHRHRVDMLNSYYDLQESRANSFQKDALKFEREIMQIQMRRHEAVLKASAEVMKAQGSVAGGALPGITSGGIVARTGGAVNQDPATRGRSTGPHLHAQGAGMTEQQLRYLVDKYLVVGGKTASSFGQSRGSQGHGYNAIDFLTPQNTPVQLANGATISQYGPAGGRGGLMGRVSTPEGAFELGHLVSLSPSGGAGAPRAVGSNERRDTVAAQRAQLAMAKESLSVRNAEAKALKDAEVALANYMATVMPNAEQRLQNELLARKNELVRSGAPEDVIDRELKLFETQEKVRYGIESVNRLREKGYYTDEQAKNAIDQLNTSLAENNRLLGDNFELQRQASIEREKADIRRQMDTAGQGLRAGFIGNAARRYESGLMKGESPELAAEMARLTQQLDMATLTASTLENAATGIGDAFAESFSSVITGSQTAQQALGQMFANVGKMFADMAAQMIAKWLLMKAVGLVAGMFGGAAAGASAPAANIQSGEFFTIPGDISTGMATAANGAVWRGGFQAFANGGMVTGPTLGLVGEGRFNEAVVPLPDGKSIPVSLGEGVGNDISTNIVVNVNNGQASSQINGNGGQSLGRELEGAVRSIILKETRPGGIIYSNR